MKRLSIALDCDGVLSRFIDRALDVVHEMTGKRFAPVDVTTFNFTKALGLSDEESRLVKNTIGSRQGFAASLEPYAEALVGVRRLRELGDVFCVTSPWTSNVWWESERTAWLARHFGIDTVHHAEDKRGYAADVFVDDKSSHVRDWLAMRPDRLGIFWRTLHNTDESVPWGAHSTSSWDALYDLAREAAKGPIQRPLPLEDASQ